MKNWLEKETSNNSFIFRDDDMMSSPKRVASFNHQIYPELQAKFKNNNRMSFLKKKTQSFSKNTLFGLVHIVDETVKTHREPSRFMLHPFSTFISYWYLITMLLLLYIFISVPIVVAFQFQIEKYLWMDVFIDCFFVLDIFVNFRTGYLPNPKRPDIVVMNAVSVGTEYLRGWFLIDLCSSIPLVTLSLIIKSFDNNSVQEQQLKLLKFMRVLRLIKLAKLNTLGKFTRLLDQIHVRLMVSFPGIVIFLQLFNLLVGAFFIVHYVACGWWMVGDSDEDSGWPAYVGAQDIGPHRQYLFSLYWVITTMTTVGYGDITAQNDAERAFSMFAMILGCAFYGLLIAQITAIVAEFDAHRRTIAERLDAISAYVRAKDFTPGLQKQILLYYRNYLKKHSTIDEWQILKDMSSGLRRQCINHLIPMYVQSNPFFLLLKDHVVELFQIMHLQVMDRGQHITRKGQASSDMMVLMAGSAVILDEGPDSVRAGHGEPCYPLFEVKLGAVFGERCVLGLDEYYQTTVRCLSDCELYVIFADELLASLGNRILEELRTRMNTTANRVRMKTYGIANIDDEDMEPLKAAMLMLPMDPIRRTWSRRMMSGSTDNGSTGQIRRRHPGRQTATADVLNQSILKLREQQNDMGQVNALSDEVSNLNSSVNDIREALTDVVMHLKYNNNNSASGGGGGHGASSLPDMHRSSTSSSNPSGGLRQGSAYSEKQGSAYSEKQWTNSFEEDEIIREEEEGEGEDDLVAEMTPPRSPNTEPHHTPHNTPSSHLLARKSSSYHNSAAGALLAPIEMPNTYNPKKSVSPVNVEKSTPGLNIIRQKKSKERLHVNKMNKKKKEKKKKL